MYKLEWKKEIIDEAKTLKEAQYLQGEYNMAYGGGVMTYKNKLNGQMFTTNEGKFYALSVFRRKRPATTINDVVKVEYSSAISFQWYFNGNR
jgi:hypothetical protein